jgi:hypothetical protein
VDERVNIPAQFSLRVDKWRDPAAFFHFSVVSGSPTVDISQSSTAATRGSASRCRRRR